jgi:hypothetical protein
MTSPFPLRRRLVLPVAIALVAMAVANAENPGMRARTYRVSPEGQPVPLRLDRSFLKTTRWDLTGIALPSRMEERLASDVNGVHLERSRLGVDGTRIQAVNTVLSASGTLPTTHLGQAALPEETMALHALGQSARIDYADASGPVRIEARTLARGWVHTPAGPFIASLRREEVYREVAGTSELEEVRLRWVSARIGTVALAVIVDGAMRARGPGHLPELGRQTVDSLSVLTDRPEESLADARGYHHEHHLPVDVRYSVGWEMDTMGDGVDIEELVPAGTLCTEPCDGDMENLMALDVWDFSGNTTSNIEKISTHVDRFTEDPTIPPNPPSDYESCNQQCLQGSGTDECGYCSPRMDYMARVDTDPDDSEGDFDLTNAVFWDDGDDGSGGTPIDPDKITVYLLAGAQHEGVSALFSDAGEGRFCADPDPDTNGTSRTPVPNVVYGHRDGCGYYHTPGDTWASGVYDCEQNNYDRTCGVDDALFGDGNYYTAACQDGAENYLGQQLGGSIKAGTVILPSGHTFNVVLTRQDISFCVYTSLSGCQSGGTGIDQVRKYVTLFNSPYLENVARLDSYGRPGANRPPNANDYIDLEETNIGTGLFPPVSVTVTGTTSTEVTLSWDPGATDFIDRHKIYWGTTLGDFSHDSDVNGGQVSGSLTVGNTSATVTGLTAGTPYYFTVTSLDSYTNPSTGVTVEYESPIFFTKDVCDPDFDYPDAVGAVPGSGCIPAGVARNLTVTKLGGGDIEYCWDATPGSCVDEYELLGSNDATSDAGWASAGDPGIATCITVANPDKVYYLSVAEGAGGYGPWGHYGR